MTDTFATLRSNLDLAIDARIKAFRSSCLAGYHIQPHHREASAKAAAQVEQAAKALNSIGHFAEGQRITSSGFPGAVVRHCDGDMYEIRLPGGVCCVDRHHIQLA